MFVHHKSEITRGGLWMSDWLIALIALIAQNVAYSPLTFLLISKKKNVVMMSPLMCCFWHTSFRYVSAGKIQHTVVILWVESSRRDVPCVFISFCEINSAKSCLFIKWSEWIVSSNTSKGRDSVMSVPLLSEYQFCRLCLVEYETTQQPVCRVYGDLNSYGWLLNLFGVVPLPL